MRQSLLLFLVSLGKFGGDVYIFLLLCVCVVDGARGLLGELFIYISNVSLPVSASTTSTTASASTGWSVAAACEAVGRKCSPLRRRVAVTDTNQIVQIGLIDDGIHQFENYHPIG